MKELAKFIIDKLERELPANLAYHNASHAKDVAAAAVRLAREENVTEEEVQLLQVAGFFHDAGHIVKRQGHELISCDIARQALPQFEFTQAQIETICDLIMATRLPRKSSKSIGRNHL